MKKLSITIPDDVYDGLFTVIGRKNISHFLSELARPHVLPRHRIAAYHGMPADTFREQKALLWITTLFGDAFHDDK